MFSTKLNQQNLIQNIFAFANFTVNQPTIAAPPAPPALLMAAAPVTLDQLTTAMNKLKGGTLSFNGSGDALGFKNKMQLLITTKGLTNDNDKLREWLGHLTSQALSWATLYFADLFNTMPNYQWLYNLAHFMATFDQTYAYYNLQDKARKQLDDLQQGRKGVGAYVQQFQSLIHHTGYGVNEVLQRFLKGLNKGI